MKSGRNYAAFLDAQGGVMLKEASCSKGAVNRGRNQSADPRCCSAAIDKRADEGLVEGHSRQPASRSIRAIPPRSRRGLRRRCAGVSVSATSSVGRTCRAWTWPPTVRPPLSPRRPCRCSDGLPSSCLAMSPSMEISLALLVHPDPLVRFGLPVQPRHNTALQRADRAELGAVDTVLASEGL